MLNKKVYIAGPVSGLPGSVSAARFARAERELRDLGYQHIINPRSMFEGTGLAWDDVMAQCLGLIRAADLVILLPGWQSSRGATMELGAAYALGIPVYEYKRLRLIRA